MSTTNLIANLTRLGIRLEGHGDRLRYSPRSAVTPDLADRMKALKGELLAMLTDDRTTPEIRRQAQAAMVERVNADYRDDPIDWPRLAAIEQRIWRAETMAELSRAVADYECAALCRNVTGPNNQYCV